MSEWITCQKEGEVAWLILNRPETFNAFHLPMVETLADRLIELAAASEVRALILTGAGKAFCAGGDLKWVTAFPQGPSGAFHLLASRFHQAVLEIRRMPKPVIAAINGIAAGGGFSLALACDFRIMAESAVLRQAYTASGLCIDGGGSYTLPRLVGLARAMEIMAFDPPIPASQALSWGLVTRVIPDDQVREAARAMADELAQKSLFSFAWSKKLLTDSFNTPFEAQIERERRGLGSCAAHRDGKEGLLAFVEKRKPVFKNKA